MMRKSIYVGNLPFSASEDEVRALFEPYGTVHDVSLINDRTTGRPRGFGFVEMEADDVQPTIDALDGELFGGRALRINHARGRGQKPFKRRQVTVRHRQHAAS